jgi:uncharacterized membrane protein
MAADISPKTRPDPRSRTRRSLAILALCLALLGGTLLRVDGMRMKRTMEFDESITYLAAASHEQAYRVAATGGLSGRWVPAQSWQNMLRPDGFWGFRAISRGLAATDNHPPLYFWILHVWTWALGLHLWTGPALNTLLAAFTALAIFLLARRAFHDALYAALASALWMASRPVVMTSLMARQYELLALCGTLLAWLAHRFMSRDTTVTWVDTVGLSLTLAAGALTHYEFFIFAAGVLLVTLFAVRRDTRRLRLVLVAAVAGGILFVVAHPAFYHSILRQRGQAVHLTEAQFLLRLKTTAAALESFFGLAKAVDLTQQHRFSARPGATGLAFAAAGLAAAILLVAIWPKARRSAWNLVRRGSGRTKTFVALFVVAALSVIAPYLVGQVPTFAMGTRYLALLWPFLAIAAVLALILLSRRNWVVVVAACVVLCLFSGTQTLRLHTPNLHTATKSAKAAHAVAIGVTQRGYLLRMVWGLPSTALVYADGGSSLFAEPTRWTGRLKSGDLVVASTHLKTASTGANGPFAAMHLTTRGPHSGWWGTGTYGYYTVER